MVVGLICAMPHPLDSARLKLFNAEKHFEIASDVCREFIRNECKAVSEYKPEANVFSIVQRLPPPPVYVSLPIGDCVHSMRAVLDHIVYALVIHNPGRPLDGSLPNIRTMFPIKDTQAGWLDKATQNRIDGVPVKAAKFINDLQPYHRRNSTPDHTFSPLWVLDKLENIDKHRRLALMSCVGSGSHVLIVGDGRDIDVVVERPNVRDGTVLCTYAAPTNSGMDVQGSTHAFIGFSEPCELPSMIDVDVLSVLRQILETLRFKVIPGFERFF